MSWLPLLPLCAAPCCFAPAAVPTARQLHVHPPPAPHPAARERIIGWYHTGPRLREADIDINELIGRYCEHPVLVICEVQVGAACLAGCLAGWLAGWRQGAGCGVRRGWGWLTGG